MDTCFIDIIIEFLSVAFHNILYYTSVYPRSIFETRKKYNVVVYRSTHPEVNQYIDLCLKSVTECLKNGQLSRIEFSVTNIEYLPLFKFVFEVEKMEYYDDTTDAYLIQAEQNLRAFCLSLSSISHKLRNLENDCSFMIHLHTNESTVVAMAINPDLEAFPMTEVKESNEALDKIIPMKRFSIRNFNIDTYVEMK